MNLKTTYWLFGAVALLLVVAAVSLMTGSKTSEEGYLLGRLSSWVHKRGARRRRPAGSTSGAARHSRHRTPIPPGGGSAGSGGAAGIRITRATGG